MRIEGPYRRPAVGKKSGTKASSAGRPAFEVDDSQPASRAAEAQASAPATEIDAILALQAVEDPMQGKRKAVRRGQALLDNLDALKAELLTGHVNEARLDRMLTLVRQAKTRVDPGLDNVIEDIELRVLVELAKHGRYVN